ncbi:hypothetical protein GCM10027569_92080 [Flindersiella endophytica]
MTEEVDNTSTGDSAGQPQGDVERLAEQLLDRADADQAQLLGPDGLLTQLTQRVLNRALDAELAEHLGYEKGDPTGRGSGNNRNGSTDKTVLTDMTVLTDIGAVPVTVPRDRNGSFEPRIVPKHARRLAGFNEQVLSLYARGMSVRDIRAHLAQLYGVEVSGDLISKVTDAVAEEITAWQNRPLDPVWPILYIPRNINSPVGEDPQRQRRQPAGLPGRGCRPGRLQARARAVDRTQPGRGRQVLDEHPGRAQEPRRDRCPDRLPCRSRDEPDGPAGRDHRHLATNHSADLLCAPDARQPAVRVHAKQGKDYPQLVPALKAIYTAPTEAAAEQALAEFEQSPLGQRYPAIGRTWRAAWPEFTPFLTFPPELRKVVYSTNLIESINARLRKVTRNRGHFPTEQAAIKVLWLAIRHLIEPRAGDRNQVAPGWKSALNALTLYFGDRIIIR